MALRVRVMLSAALVAALGCEKGEKIPAEFANLRPIAPNGEARMYVADQDSSLTRLCFDAPDLGIPAGTPVMVVHAAFPQFSTPGRLGTRTKTPCFPPPRNSPDSMQYSVDAPGDTIGRRGVPIIILGKVPPAQMRGDTVTLVIEQGRPPWEFRNCASEEGVHATAWSGKPFASPRRWHGYYYLGYDVEATCTSADISTDSTASPIPLPPSRRNPTTKR